ncbi:MAG: hypothetical protein ACOCUI_03355, partial [bacterium]
MKIDRKFPEKDMVKPITAKEFSESGALFFVNQILHLFGMAITWNSDTGEIKPAICKFRGFSEDCIDEGYKNLTQY